MELVFVSSPAAVVMKLWSMTKPSLTLAPHIFWRDATWPKHTSNIAGVPGTRPLHQSRDVFHHFDTIFENVKMDWMTVAPFLGAKRSKDPRNR